MIKFSILNFNSKKKSQFRQTYVISCQKISKTYKFNLKELIAKYQTSKIKLKWKKL